jgi:hypothetical protein
MQDSTFLDRLPLQHIGPVSPVPQAVAPPQPLPAVYETMAPQPLASRPVENFSVPGTQMNTPPPPRVMSSYGGSVSPGVASVASVASPGAVSPEHIAAKYGTTAPAQFAYGPVGTTQTSTYGQVGASYPAGIPQSMEQSIRALTPFTNSAAQRSVSLRS